MRVYLASAVGVLAFAIACDNGESSSSSTGGSFSSSSGSVSSSSSQSASAASSSSGTLAFNCADPQDVDIYEPVAATLTLPQDKGRLLDCVDGRTLTRSQLGNNDLVAYQGIAPVGGITEHVIQYVSEGPRGTPRRVTGIMSVPTGVPGPFPLVAIAPGTTGLAPGCGASLNTIYVDYLQYALVASGYATVSTDYQGLGVPDGIHPYSVGQSEGDNLLDAVRAAVAMDERAGGGVLTDEVFVLGHSQGGHAALFAHQLYDVTGKFLLGSIAFAPAFGIFYGLGSALAVPTDATSDWTGFAMMILLGHASYHGIALTDWLTPDAAQRIPELAATQCSAEFIGSVRTQWPTNAELFTPSFMSAAGTCNFDGSACPDFQPWADLLNASLPGYFTSDAPALMLYGGGDAIISSLSIACLQAGLRLSDTHVDTCSYPTDDHYSITYLPMLDALAWMGERRQGLPVTSVCQRNFTQTCPGF